MRTVKYYRSIGIWPLIQFLLSNIFRKRIYHNIYICRDRNFFSIIEIKHKGHFDVKGKTFCAYFKKFVFTIKEISRKSQKYSMRCRNSRLIACLKLYCQLHRHVSIPWKEKLRLGQVGYNMFIPIDVWDCDTKG